MAQSGEAKFIKKEIEDGQTTAQAIIRTAELEGADILVAGMHGRKGPKA